mmetsp:Transcript_25885/g.31905  ORF Transcript_25885/g.31905 Transcript_25885/m.31905 type:complete len:555 (-) Transcript_25885:55-1719(-)
MDFEYEESSHNPQTIIAQANEKLAENDLESAQMMYRSALLDWVDDAREMERNSTSSDSNINDGNDADISGYEAIRKLRDDVATLWIEYANLNRRASMFKAASEAYEQATNCPIAGKVGKVWKEYALFQQERKRPKSAQKIYLRALVGDKDNEATVANKEDRDMLWTDFLVMMKTINNDDSLTIDQLREAVDSEHTARAEQERSKEKELAANRGVKMEDGEPIAKRAKITLDINDTVSQTTTMSHPQKLVTAEAVESLASALISSTKNISAEINAEWLARDGTSLPSRPEPPLFSPSPPKLGDPSGVGLLGTELALKLIRMLLNKSLDGKTAISKMTGTVILDIVKGCWLMTAMKEKEAIKSQAALDKKLIANFEKMEAAQEVRLSVAGNAVSAVEFMNAEDKKHFLTICNQERQQLLNLISWEFRHLLAIQQEILTKTGLPYFDGATVDEALIHMQSNICAFLHSAFYLRSRIGEKAHTDMLVSQEVRLSSSQQIIPMPVTMPSQAIPSSQPMPPPSGQPVYIGQQPSYFPPPPPMYPGTYAPPPPLQNQYQYH